MVRSVRGRLEVEALLDDVVAACFDAAGDRLLLTPHPSFENRARVVNWPSLDELASFNGEVDRLYGRLDLYGCFLRADSVLLSRVEQPPIACDSNLVPVALVQLGASSLGPNAQAETVVGLSPNAFGAQLWTEDASSATAWRLPFDAMTYRRFAQHGRAGLERRRPTAGPRRPGAPIASSRWRADLVTRQCVDAAQSSLIGGIG